MQAQHDVVVLIETLSKDYKDLKDAVGGLWVVLTTKVFFYDIVRAVVAAGEN